MTVSEVPETEVRIEVFRSVPVVGGESKSSVRVAHLPSGVSVEVGTFPTQKENRAEALRQLKQRLAS